MANGNDSIFPLEEVTLETSPVLGSMEFAGINLRVGTMRNQEGENKGVIIEFWYMALPWFRFRIPFERLHAVAFIQKLQNSLDET